MPAEPWNGEPDRPELGGWHWIDVGDGKPLPMCWMPAPSDESRPAIWVAGHVGLPAPQVAALGWRYIGPAETPDQVDRLRDLIREALSELASGRHVIAGTILHAALQPEPEP